MASCNNPQSDGALTEYISMMYAIVGGNRHKETENKLILWRCVVLHTLSLLWLLAHSVFHERVKYHLDVTHSE